MLYSPLNSNLMCLGYGTLNKYDTFFIVDLECTYYEKCNMVKYGGL